MNEEAKKERKAHKADKDNSAKSHGKGKSKTDLVRTIKTDLIG